MGGAGEHEAEGGSKLLGRASIGGDEGLNGASRDSAEELGSIGKGLHDSLLGHNRTESSKMASLADTDMQRIQEWLPWTTQDRQRRREAVREHQR